MRFLLRPVSNAEIAVLVGAILSALVYCGFARVTVHNASAVTLTSVMISGNGFVRRVDALPPDSSRTFWFLPSGETSIRIAFRAHQRDVDGGEHGYYVAPPSLQTPATVTVDAELRSHYRGARLPFAN